MAAIGLPFALAIRDADAANTMRQARVPAAAAPPPQEGTADAG
jgi:hypothetical protein